MEVEIGTRESLLKFANTFGLPGGHRAAFVPWYEQPTVETDSSRSYFEHVEAASAGLGFPTSNIRDRRLVGDIHLAELALSLDLIQRMVRHVEADQAGKPVSGAWHETDYLPPKGDILSGFLDDVPAVDAAWALLANYLNQGLRPLSPGIVGMPYAYEPKEWGFHASACALIFNDLVEKAPYRRCADEKCHRLFKNQLGRGEGLHSRSDAKYCSPQHARNQSQRERRRRERAARRSGDDGQ